MSRQILFCLLVVSWICLSLGSNLQVSEASAILSSHYESFANQHNARNAPADISACTENKDIVIEYGSTERITICGSNFGNDVVGDPDEKKFEVVVAGGFKANIVAHTETYLIVTLPTNGAGQHLRVIIVLGTWSQEIPDLFVTFPQPVVTDVVPDLSEAPKRANVAQRVIIYGRSFGIPNAMIHVTATIGGFPCVGLHHVSDSELRCAVTGFGANSAVVVSVNGQSSDSGSGVLGGVTVRFDFLNKATPGLDCLPPYGSADINNGDMCNCWSGSAPSDNLLSTDCSLHASCPGRTTTQPVVGQSPPTRPETQFKDDKLWIKQTIPIVKNRRDTTIQFVVPALNVASPNTPAGTLGSPQCNFPGTLWAKKLNNLDCFDEFYGVLPWTQHELCGFVEHKDAAILLSPYRVWKSNMVTSYTETFKKADGTLVFRKVSNSFLVSVSFTRQIVVVSTPISVYIADEIASSSLEVIILGDALYDVASKNTLIQFRTTVAWPYKFDAVTLTGAWKKALGNTAVGEVSAQAVLSDQTGEYVCSKVQDTTCEQAWILTIDTDPTVGVARVCNLWGSLEFNSQPFMCRDYTTVGACAGSPNTNFTIKLGQTDLCDSAPAIDASAGLNAQLDTFYDALFEDPRSTFQTGDEVFFKLTVQDPSSTIDQITFKEITVRSSSDATIDDLLYSIPVSGDPILTATFNVGAKFNITKEWRDVGSLSPNAKGEMGFKFRLLRDKLDVVSALGTVSAGDMAKQITIEAIIDILYHGNQKRTIVATSQVPAITHTQISFYDMGEAAEELTPQNNDESAVDEESKSFFASPATTVVASVAAVAGVAALVLA